MLSSRDADSQHGVLTVDTVERKKTPSETVLSPDPKFEPKYPISNPKPLIVLPKIFAKLRKHCSTLQIPETFWAPPNPET